MPVDLAFRSLDQEVISSSASKAPGSPFLHESPKIGVKNPRFFDPIIIIPDLVEDFASGRGKLSIPSINLASLQLFFQNLRPSATDCHVA